MYVNVCYHLDFIFKISLKFKKTIIFNSFFKRSKRVVSITTTIQVTQPSSEMNNVLKGLLYVYHILCLLTNGRSQIMSIIDGYSIISIKLGRYKIHILSSNNKINLLKIFSWLRRHRL